MSRRVRPYIFSQPLIMSPAAAVDAGADDSADETAVPTESMMVSDASRARLAPPGTLGRAAMLAATTPPPSDAVAAPAGPTAAQQTAALLAKGITSIPAVQSSTLATPQAAVPTPTSTAGVQTGSVLAEGLAAMPVAQSTTVADATASAPHPLDDAFAERATQWMAYATQRLVDIDDGTVFSTEDLSDIRHVINEAAKNLDSLLQEAMVKGSPQAQAFIQNKIVSLAQGFKQYASLTGEQEQTSRSALNYLRQTDFMVTSANVQASAQNNMRVGAALQTNMTSPGVMGPGGMPMQMPMGGAPMMGGTYPPGTYPQTMPVGGFGTQFGSPYLNPPYGQSMISTPFPPPTIPPSVPPTVVR